MDKQFENNYKILKEIIKKLELLSSRPMYVGINNLVKTLQIKLESLVIAVHINKQDYLKLKKSIKSNLTDIKDLLSNANNKELIIEIKVLVETLLENCDELYLNKKNPNKEITI